MREKASVCFPPPGDQPFIEIVMLESLVGEALGRQS